MENLTPPSPFGEYCLSLQPILNDIPLLSEELIDTKDEKILKAPLLGCNCLKTKCLKLYCECFANSLYCNSECKCKNCNNKDKCENRIIAINEAFERNPEAFQHSRFTCSRGCNCKRSGCRKKYCECFLNGVSCSAVCRCEMCKNITNH